MPLSKKDRLILFYEELGKAPPVDSAEKAFRLLAEKLNAVEDAHSGVKSDSRRWKLDGRMYPPQEDNACPVDGCPGLTVYRSRGHRTFIGENGAIEIWLLSGKVVFSKPGKNGRDVRGEHPDSL